MSDARRGRAEAGLFLMSILLSLASLEGVVRVGRYIAPPVAPKGGYAPIRGRRSRAPQNAAGYRDVAHVVPKPKDVRRIVFVGDSFTYGVGILFDDTYPRRIARALSSARGEKWEAVVLAVPGDDAAQEAEIVASEGFFWEPDLVVLGYVLNDAELPDAAEQRRAADWVEREALRKHPPAWRSSALLSLVADRLHATRENENRVKNHLDLYRPGTPNLASVNGSLDRMAGLCREHHVPFVVAIFPLFANSFDDEYPFQSIHQTMGSLCEAKKIECVDLLKSYRGLDWRILVVEGANDEHPNELAHRIAADALLGPIEKNLPRATRADNAAQGLLVPARP